MGTLNGSTHRRPLQPDGSSVGLVRESHEMAERGQAPTSNTPFDGTAGAHYTGAHGHGIFHLADGKDVGQALREDADRLKQFGIRFSGRDRWVPWSTSLVNVMRSSVLNIFFVFIPIAWVSHFLHWKQDIAFALCFLAIMPLEKMFDFLGEEMGFYLGKSLEDLLVITLNNIVEATLAIILLVKCELRLLQATIAGVVVLHLLLIPGMAFLTGGARILEQNLHAHNVQLNLSLLTVGVLSILLPTAFFSALDRGTIEPAETGLVSDTIRGQFLRMSQGIAIILLIIRHSKLDVASRIYLHNPPGEDNALQVHNAPTAMKHEEHHLEHGDPKVNVWTCLIFLGITIAIMATTAEFLVESIEHVRETQQIGEEWFGLILLPIVSFAADGAVATIFFVRYAFRIFFGTPPPPAELAKGRAIDLSIQFTLFWLPFLVLLGWWIERPFHVLFDYYELAILLGACFLVNYVTADAKTNWVEGLIMVSFYVMIALVTWWYPGQESSVWMLRCHGVLIPDTHETEGGEGGSHGESESHGGGTVQEEAARLLIRMAARAVATQLA